MTMRAKFSRLSGRYLVALRNHLRRGPRARLHLAGGLGRQALENGMETSDLARIHEQAMVILVSPGEAFETRDGMIKRAGTFFIEAISPIEKTHRAVQKANVQLMQLNATLRRRTVGMAAVKRNMKAEIVRRQTVEEALQQSERHYGNALAQSRQLQEQLRHLTRELLLAQEEERKRISHELHDEISQTLTGINVHLAALTREATVNTKGLVQKIAHTQQLVEKSVNIVHRFARELRPMLLDDLGLIPALHSYMKDFTKRTGIHIRFTAFTAGKFEQLDSGQRTVLYRVVQEALTNVAKHAQASLVNVSILKLRGAIRLEINDDGKSFAVDRVLLAKRHKRLGLLGMRERVEMVGGSFAVESAPGQGTTIRAQIPFGRRARV